MHLHSFITWQGPAAFQTCKAEVNHKLVSISAVFRLHSHSPHSGELNNPSATAWLGSWSCLGGRLSIFGFSFWFFSLVSETLKLAVLSCLEVNPRRIPVTAGSPAPAIWSRWISPHSRKEEYRNRDSFSFMAAFC